MRFSRRSSDVDKTSIVFSWITSRSSTDPALEQSSRDETLPIAESGSVSSKERAFSLI
jgi:hypothetical protein